MSTRPVFDENDYGAGTLIASALVTLVSGLLWVVVILAIRWVLQLPPPALLRLAGVAGIFAGTGLVFWSLVRLELMVPPSPDRARRPARGAAPPGAASASPGDTAPPPAGGRALRVVRGRT